MSGDPTTRRVLQHLLTMGPIDATSLGAAVWRDLVRHGPIYAKSNGGGDYAMQMLLGRLRRRGLVRVAHDESRTSQWELTEEGRKLAR